MAAAPVLTGYGLSLLSSFPTSRAFLRSSVSVLISFTNPAEAAAHVAGNILGYGRMGSWAGRWLILQQNG